jgi:lipopolysaccharide transport system ATP-binding protein
MSSAIITVDGLGKRYRIGTRREASGMLRESIVNAARGMVGGVGRLFGGRGSAATEDFWALKDVSFEVQPGEVVGIIGRNGAGKSTLLKILSRITEPTTGRAVMRGRVGSLLEVGTGFHPELTGRENIYLSGAILGMRKAEIDRKFDEIVAFAGVEKFLDTPIKRYSSGMNVRLGFAVAAHLDPEILLVDEVLAVGDAEFQKKCLGKMEEVSKGGRTILFVSHNMGAISRLCGKSVWLEAGITRRQGATTQLVCAYLMGTTTSRAERKWPLEIAPGDDALRLLGARIRQDGAPCASLDITKPTVIELEVLTVTPARETNVFITLTTADGNAVIHTSDLFSPNKHPPIAGVKKLSCSLPPYALNVGQYAMSIAADIPHVRLVLNCEGVLHWSVEGTCPLMARYGLGTWRGVVGPGLAQWASSSASPSFAEKGDE